MLLSKYAFYFGTLLDDIDTNCIQFVCIIFASLFRTSWLTFNTPSHGNCFAFNHVSNPNDPRAGKRKSAFPGQFTGLKLILNLELVEYIKNELTESSGALALIQASKIAFH